MDDAVLVGGFERIGNLLGDEQGLIGRDRPCRKAVGKCRPLDQLHHEGVHAARLFDAVDSSDVRVIQRGERPGLALESGEPLRVLGKALGQDLDRHVALQLAVPGPIDLAHAAGPDGGEDFVRTEASAGLQGQDGAPQDCIRQPPVKALRGLGVLGGRSRPSTLTR